MNKIVREHYPVSQLPEELQKEFPGQDEVTLTVEIPDPKPSTQPAPPFEPGTGPFSRFRHLAQPNFSSVEEVVAHVRALRDEWDERDQLHERLRNGS